MAKVISVGFIIRCKDGRYLLGKADSTPEPYCWTIFKGRTEVNESLIDTAIRELKEETGIDIAVDHRLNQNISTNPIYNYSMKRKDVHVYLLSDTCGVLDDFKLNCSSYIPENGRPEIIDYRRFSLDELQNNIFPSQRGIIEVLRKMEEKI